MSTTSPIPDPFAPIDPTTQPAESAPTAPVAPAVPQVPLPMLQTALARVSAVLGSGDGWRLVHQELRPDVFGATFTRTMVRESAFTLHIHLVLLIFTFGLWLLPWIFIATLSPRRVWTETAIMTVGPTGFVHWRSYGG